jgi:hypothetical protein
MYPRIKNWSYNKLIKPHETEKVIEIVNPEIVSIESNNNGKLIRPDGSNEKISFKKPVQKLEGKGTSKATANKKKKKQVRSSYDDRRASVRSSYDDHRASVHFKESESESSDYEEPEEPRKRPAQRLLETIKNEKKDEHIKSSKNAKRNPKKQMSDEDKKKIAELMKRLRG